MKSVFNPITPPFDKVPDQISDISGLQAALDGKAASSHTHSESDVTGLVSDLAGKAPLSHTHAASDIASGSLAQARQSILASGAYLIAPWDQYPASNVSAAAASANNVHVFAFIPKATITVNSIHFDIQAASAGGLCSVGVYSADGNTKLIDSGTKSTTSTGTQSTTLGSPVTLYANTLYWAAYTHDNTTSAVRGIAAALTGVSNIFNAGTVQMGTAANSASAGALPSTLGAISAASRVAPLIKLQG